MHSLFLSIFTKDANNCPLTVKGFLLLYMKMKIFIKTHVYTFKNFWSKSLILLVWGTLGEEMSFTDAEQNLICNL